MPVTKVGIVYATGSGIVRRWITPDNDADLIASHPVSPGEAMVLVDAATIPNVPAQAQPFVEAAILRVTGRRPPSARCAMIDDQGVVVGSLMADPDLDQVPGHTLVLHDRADRGWQMRAGALADVAAEAAAAASAGVAVLDADPHATGLSPEQLAALPPDQLDAIAAEVGVAADVLLEAAPVTVDAAAGLVP